MLRKINSKKIRIPGNGQDSSSVSPTTETVVRVMPLGANDLRTDDVARVRTVLRKGTGFNSTFTIKIYWNTSTSLTGAVQLATFTCTGTDSSPSIHRVFVVKSSSSLEIFSPTTSSNSSLGESTAAGNLVTGLNFATSGYILVSVIRTSSGRANDSIVCSYLSLEV
jgi:hypothetical protein